MNFDLIHFLVYSPEWFIAMWAVLIVSSLVLVWQGTRGGDDA